jgi:HK97 gp10 family phage protein
MSEFVQGAEQLQQKLSELSKTHAKAAIRKGTRAGAKIVQAEAKNRVPVRTGRLKKGLKVRAMPRKKNYVGTMVRLADTGEVFYGGFVEFGTKYIKPRHYLENASKAVKDAALNKAITEAKAEIERRMAQ